ESLDECSSCSTIDVTVSREPDAHTNCLIDLLKSAPEAPARMGAASREWAFYSPSSKCQPLCAALTVDDEVKQGF
ncbi:hypothetical protein, partial [Kushneria aurantia]|uniref:hypothetical protein n=1 Tax=Kushneria aurantia TaxID=504092 RepID=UPI001B7FD5CC